MLPRAPTSFPDFVAMFPNDAACARYLEVLRWPSGFRCAKCGFQGEPFRFAKRPHVVRCKVCEEDSSVTAGTIMHRTHSPLTTWFWAAYLAATQTPGESATQFQRKMGMKRHETAFMMLHKLRAAMVRPDRDKIGESCPVEVDETLVGGKTRGEGHGVHHKTLVVGAVEVCDAPSNKRRGVQAGRLRLTVVASRTARCLTGFVSANVRKRALVRTDGFSGYSGLGKLGFDHDPLVIDGDQDKTEAHLPMIHIVFGNLKTWLDGTHHGVSAKHLQQYLNEFVFRFNRRFHPLPSFQSVLSIGTMVRSPTYAEVYAGDYDPSLESECFPADG